MLSTAVPGSARPTSARVREALFSIVGHDLSGQSILDAFGGSGLLALEAWSRGARVVVVERVPAAARAIRGNVRGLDADVEVHVGDIYRLVNRLGPFDGVIADPPYAADPHKALVAVAGVRPRWIVLETRAETEPPEAPADLALDRRRCYGGTALCVYRREA